MFESTLKVLVVLQYASALGAVIRVQRHKWRRRGAPPQEIISSEVIMIEHVYHAFANTRRDSHVIHIVGYLRDMLLRVWHVIMSKI
jgi:hypothetical protein